MLHWHNRTDYPAASLCLLRLSLQRKSLGYYNSARHAWILPRPPHRRAPLSVHPASAFRHTQGRGGGGVHSFPVMARAAYRSRHTSSACSQPASAADPDPGLPQGSPASVPQPSAAAFSCRTHHPAHAHAPPCPDPKSACCAALDPSLPQGLPRRDPAQSALGREGHLLPAGQREIGQHAAEPHAGASARLVSYQLLAAASASAVSLL